MPLALKEKSTRFEQQISKELYRDFSQFRIHLFENIIKNNWIPSQARHDEAANISEPSAHPELDAGSQIADHVRNDKGFDKQTLLRLTQKLCDRIIFILFAEDRGLLTPNTIKEIRHEFQNQKFTSYTLYDIYKFYFNAINEGNEKLNIPRYNGGLFAKDELLDSLRIEDAYLDMKAQKLSDYDFLSDISVNILGHIFEQSLTDLEELNASIHEIEFDKKKSKRKKDGIFYTPEYITRYIVQNTLGKLCEEKRQELSLGSEVLTSPINPKKLTKAEKETLAKLYAYRDWLLNLKILDPACGSGAFLNQALEFLIREHRNVDEYRRAYENEALSLYDIETNILEHNLYGVDINEDAVEIAKLSLWLRTAHRGREMTNLSRKIKCGNSLIDDKTMADNAFVWEEEFPEVFNPPVIPAQAGIQKKGFDAVIGNPPYVRVQGLKSNYEDESKLYEAKYQSATGNYDIYALFLEMSFKMLNQNGKLSYILPHKFLISDFGSGLRRFLAENRAVESLLHFGSEMVFEDASTYTCIITLSHDNEILNFKSISPKDIFEPFTYDTIDYEKLNSSKWNLSNQDTTQILEKINRQPLRVKDIFTKIFTGIQTSGDDVYLLLQTKDGLYSKALDCIVEVENELLKPMLKGEDISRYKNLQNRYFVIFPYLIENGKAKPMSEDFIKENYPKGYEYLKANEEFLRGREKGKMDKEGWFLYIYPKSLSEFEQPKIITSYMGNFSNLSFDSGDFYHNTKCYGFIKKDEIKENYKFYLSVLNSSLFWFFVKNTSTEFRGGYFTFTTNQVEPFPLPKLENLEQQEPFIEKADKMLLLNKQLQEIRQNFTNELGLEKLPKKLQNFEELEFDEFVKEYAKAKKLKFADKLAERNFKQEWQALFENDKTLTCKLKEEIAATDKEIDEMVYKLYGLTEDEIRIVEGA